VAIKIAKVKLMRNLFILFIIAFLCASCKTTTNYKTGKKTNIGKVPNVKNDAGDIKENSDKSSKETEGIDSAADETIVQAKLIFESNPNTKEQTDKILQLQLKIKEHTEQIRKLQEDSKQSAEKIELLQKKIDELHQKLKDENELRLKAEKVIDERDKEIAELHTEMEEQRKELEEKHISKMKTFLRWGVLGGVLIIAAGGVCFFHPKLPSQEGLIAVVFGAITSGCCLATIRYMEIIMISFLIIMILTGILVAYFVIRSAKNKKSIKDKELALKKESKIVDELIESADQLKKMDSFNTSDKEVLDEIQSEETQKRVAMGKVNKRFKRK